MKLSADSEADSVGRIAVTYLDGNKKNMKASSIDHADYPAVRDGKFRRCAFLSQVPSNAAYMKVSLESRRTAPGKVWFDNVTVKTLK